MTLPLAFALSTAEKLASGQHLLSFSGSALAAMIKTVQEVAFLRIVCELLLVLGWRKCSVLELNDGFSERRVAELCAVALPLKSLRLHERPLALVCLLEVPDLDVEWRGGGLYSALAPALKFSQLLVS